MPLFVKLRETPARQCVVREFHPDRTDEPIHGRVYSEGGSDMLFVVDTDAEAQRDHAVDALYDAGAASLAANDWFSTTSTNLLEFTVYTKHPVEIAWPEPWLRAQTVYGVMLTQQVECGPARRF